MKPSLSVQAPESCLLTTVFDVGKIKHDTKKTILYKSFVLLVLTMLENPLLLRINVSVDVIHIVLCVNNEDCYCQICNIRCENYVLKWIP